MRDRRLHEALARLAAEAARRFSSLVATGEEIPFDVAEADGEHTFYRYEPLTSRFVIDHEQELQSLPSFAAACAAITAAGVAAPYLEAQGMAVPEDEDSRAAEMLIAFVCNLWEGAAEFTLDRARLASALAELDAESVDVSEVKLLIAPLVGLKMPLARLVLPGGVRIARADTIDAPGEALHSEGMNRRAWEPQFFALAEQESGPEGSLSALRQLRELISVMRLFKEGGIGLAPYVFAPTGEERWRRVATGVPETRPGGYEMSEAEAAELAEFARRLEVCPDPRGALAWAVARFEMGCERPTALEGLSDHLLALRAIFEREGPVGAALPMRVAALISEPGEREEARAKVQSAFELERALMAGLRPDTGSALGLSAWLEDAARAILRDAALGAHGDEIGTAADQMLVTAGVEAGEGSAEQMGATAEWDAIVPEEPVGERRPPVAELEVPDGERIVIRAGGRTPVVEQEVEEPGDGLDADDWFEDEPGDDHDDEEAAVRQSSERDWLAEVSPTQHEDTLEWPARRAVRDSDEPVDTPRVRHLFPVPEDADWEVGELRYDRDRTRSRVG